MNNQQIIFNLEMLIVLLIFAFLMIWDRFSIFLLKKRVSALENKIGIKSYEDSDKPK